jgi:ssDNA-binding DdrB-like protein
MIATSVQGIETHLRQIAFSSNVAPNYQRHLSEYPTFDWSSIGTTVLNRDSDGVTAVEWSGLHLARSRGRVIRLRPLVSYLSSWSTTRH